eukprot:757352-Hanusia_phi.AAC.2
MRNFDGSMQIMAAEPRNVVSDDIEAEEQQLDAQSLTRSKLLILSHIVCVLASFFLLFSEIGFGASVFKGLIDGYAYSTAAAVVGFVVFMCMYMFDFNVQGSAAKSKCCDQHAFIAIKNLLMLVVLVSVLISAALSFKTQPQAPLLTYIVVGTLYFTLMRIRFFGKPD